MQDWRIGRVGRIEINLEISCFVRQILRIFAPRIVLGTVLEVFGSIGGLQEAPREYSEGAGGPKSRPREAKRTTKKVPRWTKKATRRPIWGLLGLIWDEILVKLRVKMERFRKRQT